MIRTQKKGFTLIELLVVIAIIAILAAILFPIFITARDGARQASCASNMNQLARAALMYADAFEGRLPPYDYNASGKRIMWYDCLYPYLKTKKTLICPSLRFNADAKDQTNLPAYNRISGIGVPWPHIFWDTLAGAMNPKSKQPGLVLTAIPRSSQVMMLIETYFTEKDASKPTFGTEVGFPVAYCPGCYGTGSSYDPLHNNVAARHRGRANVAFLDGHIKSFSRDLITRTYTKREEAPLNDIWAHFEPEVSNAR